MSGPSTVSNIYITPPTAPTIACAEVVPGSPHHDNIALFCANTRKTDSPQQLRRLVMPLEHSNDPPVPPPSVAAWPPTIFYSYKPSPTGTTAMGTQLVNIGAISNREESSPQMKVGSVFRRWIGRVRVWRRRGERYEDACVMERNTWFGGHRDQS